MNANIVEELGLDFERHRDMVEAINYCEHDSESIHELIEQLIQFADQVEGVNEIEYLVLASFYLGHVSATWVSLLFTRMFYNERLFQ